MDNINYSADKPIYTETKDRFQRYAFAKRIATTIIERQSSDCLVIGLHGAWGEGKTSVLNFINQELSNDDNVIIIKFNPWRFKDEDLLLNDFFKLLAIKLDASLKSSGEKIGSLLKKYNKLSAPLINLIPYAGKLLAPVIENIADILPSETLEDLKEKIDAILKENIKKIVVFIDDIDRLDKNEIHSIFRLVKLTADFYNTTYILSFDEKMVAAAIGERFGEGNKESGKSFLEKIIQVPLNLPVAQREVLQQFCFDIINNVFSTLKIELDENEGKVFSNQFQSYILLRLTTPRLAVRYGNTLSFSIPLLFGEVNIDDLLIIEAIKIFYPAHYNFIKSNPDFFIGSYKEIYNQRIDEKKIDLLNKHFDDLANNLTQKEKDSIKHLLIDLFPRLNEVYNNHYYDNRTEGKLYKKMHIGSPRHFNRFFTYSVIKGDLSDIAFKNFILEIPEQSIKEITFTIEKLVIQSSADNFLIKIRSFEEDYDWNISKKIMTAIVSNTMIFPKHEGSFFMRFQTPYGQSQILIYQLVKKHENKEEVLEFLKTILEVADSFNYAYDLNDWLRSEKEENRIFAEKQLLELDYVLIKRALAEAKDISIIEKFENNIVHLLNSWNTINPKELTSYVEKIIQENPNNAFKLLKIYTPLIRSSLFPDPYKTDFLLENYNHFISLFDETYITNSILEIYTIEEINNEDVKWIGREDNNQTDLNIIRQFFYWKTEKENPND